MSKSRYRSNRPDEMSVGSFIGTREQPEIAYAKGKLEASDTYLIKWSPSKIDLVKRDEQKCMNSP